MTDRDIVYTKVKKTMKRMLKLDHQGQVVTLAMMISGLVPSRKAQLSAMSSEAPSQIKDQSIEMRMRRWVKEDLDVEAVYRPFARQILEAWSHQPLVFVMDGSQAERGCMVLIGWCVISEKSVADCLAGLQRQKRTCHGRPPYSITGKGHSFVAQG